jgi:hypothetical protein
MSNLESILLALDEAWDPDGGFLGKLREGFFDEAMGDAYLELLRSVPPAEGMVDSRLAKSIWLAPQFMLWQLDALWEGEGKQNLQLRRLADEVHEAVASILGVP